MQIDIASRRRLAADVEIAGQSQNLLQIGMALR